MSFFNATKRLKFIKIAVNSLAYFMLAYITVIGLTNSFSILVAHIEGVSGKLYYYGFDLIGAGSSWSSELTFLIFFFGIGFSFLLGLIFERIYKKIRKYTRHSKMFFLWGFVISFTYFLGNILVGAFFYFGTGVIFDKFSVPWMFRIISGVIAFAGLIYLGFYATRGFIISLNNYQRLIERQELKWFIRAQVIFPAIAGNLLILLLKVPMQNYVKMLDTLVWATMIIPMISLYINLSAQQGIRFRRKQPEIRIFPVPVVIVIIVALLYRFGLVGGLQF